MGAPGGGRRLSKHTLASPTPSCSLPKVPGASGLGQGRKKFTAAPEKEDEVPGSEAPGLPHSEAKSGHCHQ